MQCVSCCCHWRSKAKAKMGLGLGRACRSSTGGEREFWYLHGVKVCIRGPNGCCCPPDLCTAVCVCTPRVAEQREEQALVLWGSRSCLGILQMPSLGSSSVPMHSVSCVPITAALGLLSRQPTAKNLILCISSGVTSRTRAVNVLLCLAQVKPRLKCCVRFWAPEFRKDIEWLE